MHARTPARPHAPREVDGVGEVHGGLQRQQGHGGERERPDERVELEPLQGRVGRVPEEPPGAGGEGLEAGRAGEAGEEGGEERGEVGLVAPEKVDGVGVGRGGMPAAVASCGWGWGER